jgi:hypothetical protein
MSSCEHDNQDSAKQLPEGHVPPIERNVVGDAENRNVGDEHGFTRRDVLGLTAGALLGGIGADASSALAAEQDDKRSADRKRRHPSNAVARKLAELGHRIPGRITAPDEPEVRTAIAGQLVVVDEDAGIIVIQVGPNAYGLAIDDIEEIFDAQGPTPQERDVGVTVVIVAKSNRVSVTTQAQNIVPRREVPFALAETESLSAAAPSSAAGLAEFAAALNNRFVEATSQPLIRALPESLSAALIQRTQIWELENGLFSSSFDRFGVTDQCTIRNECTQWTVPFFPGPIVCDRFEGLQCRGR